MAEEAYYPTADSDFRRKVEPTGSRFAELRESFLLEYTRSTALAYWGDLDSLYRWAEERGLDVLALSNSEKQRYLEDLRKNGYSPSTAARRLRVVERFYTYLA